MQPKTFFLIHGRSCQCFIKKVLENTKILNWSTKDGTFCLTNCQSVTPIHRKQSYVANIWWGHETNMRWLWWDARCSVWKVLRFLNQWEHFIPTISPHPPHGHLGKELCFFLFLLWHHLVKCSEAQKTCQRYFKKAHQWTPGGFIGQAGYLTSNSLKKTSSLWLVSHYIVCILTEQEF